MERLFRPANQQKAAWPCFWTEPEFGSFFPYGNFVLAGGRIWKYAARILLVDQNVDTRSRRY